MPHVLIYAAGFLLWPIVFGVAASRLLGIQVGRIQLAPSGLVLYWTVSNLWAIGQQALTNRLIGPSARPGRGEAERRAEASRKMKSAGAGRTDQAAKERK